MLYEFLFDHDNTPNAHEIPLIQRLLQARGVTDTPEDFLNPNFSRYRQEPWVLNDIHKAVDRIIQAINNKEKIMIFGDYDVDGVSSSYIMYVFFKKFLHYPDISIRLPHRLHDGYGIKSYHLDEIHAAGVSLVITVDNGITAIQEAKHAKEIWLDMIITDHHRQLDEIPDALAVVNPHVSPAMRFHEICGASVAFKVIWALTDKLITDRARKDEIFHYFVPIVAIASVADCMPLVDENRLLVKYGLERINARKGIPESLANFLDYLKIKWPIDTYHIGFQISPRLNAGWRVMTPYDSLYTLIHTGEKQLAYLENLDKLNDQRRKMQEEMIKHADTLVDPLSPIVMVWSPDFHEWVIGIVAGRLADKHNKPTIVYSENHEDGFAVASLRAPTYASIIDLLYNARDLLDRYGGHKQAGWMTIKLENLDAFRDVSSSFAAQRETAERQKIYKVDTILHPHEYTTESLRISDSLAPFWEANREPLFLIPQATITGVEKVWKTWNGHLKIHARHDNTPITTVFRGAGNEIDTISIWQLIDIIWTLKKDDYRGGIYIKGEDYRVDTL